MREFNKNQIFFLLITIFFLILFLSLACGVINKDDKKVDEEKIFVISNPYIKKDKEYKGQLHAHTTNSDGNSSPSVLMTAYKNKGYDFLAITDHNLLTPDPCVSGILYIKGVEETSKNGHIQSIGIGYQVVSKNAQVIIDEIIEGGGIAIMNHPNWKNGKWSIDNLRSINNYSGIEIFNDTIFLNKNAEDKWDVLLSEGKKIFGIASDDTHNINKMDNAWIKVFANNLTTDEILDSIKAGNFYSSTGPTLSISIDNGKILISTDNLSDITFINLSGKVSKFTANTTTAFYNIIGDEVYIRIKITRIIDGKNAWSNPIYINEK